MPFVLLVSPSAAQWRAFTEALHSAAGIDVKIVHSAMAAFDAVQEQTPAAVVIDAHLGDMTGAELVRRLIEINAMIQVALVSPDSSEVFHEKNEGLGIMMQLPPDPGQTEAGRMVEKLRQLAVIS